MTDVYIVSEWLRYARMDHAAAIHLRSFHPMPIETICYHCQQAAEKALKTVLIHHDREVPQIHDTSHLLQLAIACDSTLLLLTAQASYQRKFSSVTRYPNELELNESNRQRALDGARTIVETFEALRFEARENGGILPSPQSIRLSIC